MQTRRKALAELSTLADDDATFSSFSGVDQLIASDHDYFRAGALALVIEGGSLVWDPTSCIEGIVLMTKPSAAEANPAAWVRSLQRAQLQRGLQRLRVYFREAAPLLGQALAQAGFKERVELLFTGTPNKPISTIDLRPVLSADDWQRKLVFHEEVSDRPDGYACSAAEWISLEKTKVLSMGMQPFLVCHRDAVVGAVSTIDVPALLRIKNLVIHTEWRGQGIAQQILGKLSSYGELSGVRHIGVMAVSGTAGESLYRRAGLTEQGNYYEWSI